MNQENVSKEHSGGAAAESLVSQEQGLDFVELLFNERCRAVTLSGEDYWAIPRDLYDQLRVAAEDYGKMKREVDILNL